MSVSTAVSDSFRASVSRACFSDCAVGLTPDAATFCSAATNLLNVVSAWARIASGWDGSFTIDCNSVFVLPSHQGLAAPRTHPGGALRLGSAGWGSGPMVYV